MEEIEQFGNVLDDRVRLIACNRFGKPWFEITDFELQGATQTWNEADDFSFSISPLHPAAFYIPLKARDFEIRLHIPGQEQPLWGEPVSVRGGTAGITFQCVGHLGWFAERFIDRSSLIFTSEEQGEIMSSLVRYAQDETHQAYRDMNIKPVIVDPGTLHKKLRSREYFREEHENILDALNDFQSTDTPVDIRMHYATDNIYGVGNWFRDLQIVPRYDTIYEQATPLYYSVANNASNLVSFSWAEDAAGLVTDVYCGGGSSGDIRFEGHYTDQFAASLHYARQGIINDGDRTDPDWLRDKAKGDVDKRKRPVQTVSIDTIGVRLSVGRRAHPGTIWPLRIDYGRIQVNGNFRVISRSMDSSDVVSLQLQQMQVPILRPTEVFGAIPFNLQGGV